MKFGDNLKKLRLEKGMTQEQLCTAAGISRRAYIDYENNKSTPKTKATYLSLANALGCDLKDLGLTAVLPEISGAATFAGMVGALGVMGMPLSGILSPALIASGLLMSKQMNKSLLNKNTEKALQNDKFVQDLASIQRQFKALSTGLLCSKLSEFKIGFSIHETDSYDLSFSIENQLITRWCFDFWSENIKNKDNNEETYDSKARIILSKYMLLTKNKHRKISIVVDNIKLFDSLLLYKDKNSYYGNLSIVLIDSKKVILVDEQYLAYYSGELKDKLPTLI